MGSERQNESRCSPRFTQFRICVLQNRSHLAFRCSYLDSPFSYSFCMIVRSPRPTTQSCGLGNQNSGTHPLSPFSAILVRLQGSPFHFHFHLFSTPPPFFGPIWRLRLFLDRQGRDYFLTVTRSDPGSVEGNESLSLLERTKESAITGLGFWKETVPKGRREEEMEPKKKTEIAHLVSDGYFRAQV